jgi:hypothetical protein
MDMSGTDTVFLTWLGPTFQRSACVRWSHLVMKATSSINHIPIAYMKLQVSSLPGYDGVRPAQCHPAPTQQLQYALNYIFCLLRSACIMKEAILYMMISGLDSCVAGDRIRVASLPMCRVLYLLLRGQVLVRMPCALVVSHSPGPDRRLGHGA